MDNPIPNPNLTTADVLEAICTSGKEIRQWGEAVDSTPILSARSGGDRQPPIFITAGVHAHEPAGVNAALNLLHGLDTEHEVHILPLRDPFGFAGVNHCLSVAAGEKVVVPDHRAALDYLLLHGELISNQGEVYLFKLGDFGFLWNKPTPGSEGSRPLTHFMHTLMWHEPDLVRSLWGKSLMLLLTMGDVEGVGELQHCFHMVISSTGELMHLNRFFGREDAPPEVVAVDHLIQQIKPGLTCDLHEGAEQGFWMPVPKPEKNPEQPLAVARAFLDVIQACHYPITTYEEWVAIYKVMDQERVGPESRLPGLLWTHTLQAGEGHNLSSYAALHGVAIDTEAPIMRSLAMRVDGITNGILAAIRAWERTLGRN
jgi:hypothetical protein